MNKYKLSNPFSYDNDCQYAIEDPVSFWKDLSKNIHWDKEYDSVYSGNEYKPDWFKGGLLNLCYNILDLNIRDPSIRDRNALIYECPYLNVTKKLSYIELYNKVCSFSGVLLTLGIQKGDVVMVYMSTSIEAAIVMLSCARIGAIHAVVYGGFSSHVFAKRLENCNPKLLVLSSCGFSNNQFIKYTPDVIKALEISNHKPDNIITLNRNEINDQEFINSIPKVPNSFDWDTLMNSSKPFYGYIPVEATHPLYILYTSGTTGEPKGIVRDTLGTFLGSPYMYTTVMPIKSPIGFINTNIGWASCHVSIYTYLALKGTLVLFEGVAMVSNENVPFWEIIERNKVNYFFTNGSTIKIISKHDPMGKSLEKYNLSALDTVIATGEVIDETIFNFISKVMKKNINNWLGQTESAIPLIMTYKGEEKIGKIGKPLPGIPLCVVSEQSGEELPANQLGELTIKLPLPPGYSTSIYKSENGFHDTYLSTYKGYYRTGDLGFKDQDGIYTIVSRADDTIIVATLNIKAALIENQILKHPKIIECYCIGITDQYYGQVPIAFIILKEEFKNKYDFKTLKDEITKLIELEDRSYAVVKKLIIVNNLPKTRNGKKTKTVLKKLINDSNYKIPSSVEDPEIYDEILSFYKNQKYY